MVQHMGNEAPLVCAVMLNYKNPELTIKSATCVLDAAKELQVPIRIIVVDNSAPETAHTLRSRLQSAFQHQVQLIENAENVGFAKANNQGVHACTSKYILLLNNDVFINSDCLRLGLAFLEEHPHVGIWAPRLVGPDGKNQVSTGNFPTLAGVLREYILGWIPRAHVNEPKRAEPTPVDTVVAAVWLMSRRTWEIVGPLDESYFFTMEDVDYCKRVNDAGLSVVYDLRCSVTHIRGSSQPWPWHRNPFLHHHRVLYFRKHHGRAKTSAATGIIRLGLALRRFKERLTRRYPP